MKRDPIWYVLEYAVEHMFGPQIGSHFAEAAWKFYTQAQTTHAPPKPEPPYSRTGLSCPRCHGPVACSASGVYVCPACHVVLGERRTAQRGPHVRVKRGRSDRTAAPPAQKPRAAAYKTLGLKVGASPAAIRARRRELAWKHHPDRGGAAGKLAEINAAADLLLVKAAIQG